MEPSALIRRPERVDVRELWPSEPNDFTPWLADNLDLLELPGLGRLSLVGQEHPVAPFNRSLDLLAITDDGERVAIENQYATANHDHLTRALAYAVGLDARAVVVVAEHHLDEFRAVADYLNDCAEHQPEGKGIGVFLVQLTVERIEHFYVPRFDIVSRPNAWLQQMAISGTKLLSSVEEFLEMCEQEHRSSFEAIIQYWAGPDAPSGARVSHKAQASVALYCENPVKGLGSETCVFVLDAYGGFTINRGYLIEAGLNDDASIADLDRAMDRHFPGYRRTPKNYYPKTAPPTVEQVQGFAQWLETQPASTDRAEATQGLVPPPGA